MEYFRRHLEKIPTTLASVEVADRETIGILVLYLLPLLKTSFTELQPLTVVPALVIFLALAIVGYNFHFNPLLVLLGWKFYKVTTAGGVGYLMITRREFRRVDSEVTVGRLTSYTLVDMGD